MPIISTSKTLRPRAEHDVYLTPLELCQEALTRIAFTPKRVLDPGAGGGVWGEAARMRWPDAMIHGIELRDVPRHAAYNVWSAGVDFLMCSEENLAGIGYDLIIGNPPYRYAEAFIRQSLAVLKQHGFLIQLLPLQFLESQRRSQGLWRDDPPLAVHVLDRRPSFTQNGRTDATAYAVYIWQKGVYPAPTALFWLRW